ncbi:hypothetical protein [Serratia microhaemolytica]|uniref:hypothetical protein n=1 Tax=Serratia microhaemolytica TaxID=2675110 RepID=UPI000FDF2633|nr:hypothetical protein [Serratia microhaemolytica]
MSTKRKHTLCWWVLTFTVLALLYTFRVAIPIVFFKYEPYAEIEAVIPTDMKLYVSASYHSSACKFITFSNFKLISTDKGWSKEYSPDAQGRVKAKIYKWAWGPCNWGLEGFSISTAYTKIPSTVLSSNKITDEIKQEVVRRFPKKSRHDLLTAGMGFGLAKSYLDDRNKDVNHVSLHTTLTPSIIKRFANDNTSSYRFDYDDEKRKPNNFRRLSNLSRSRQQGSLKIKYTVDVDSHILYEEFHPHSAKNTSRLLE